MIGVDHFFLYMADHDWNNQSGVVWPILDFVTYVPFNVNLPGESRPRSLFEFQTDAMNDAIYRARAAGIAWSVHCDLDEYIMILDETATKSAPERKLLPTFLESRRLLTPHHGSIEGETVTYGNPLENVDGGFISDPPFLMDYVWRSTHGFGNQRQKSIVHTPYIVYHSIHYLMAGGQRLKMDPWTELRFNHYKNPIKGVFLNGIENATVFDSSFRDLYRDEVAMRLERLLDG